MKASPTFASTLLNPPAVPAFIRRSGLTWLIAQKADKEANEVYNDKEVLCQVINI